GAGAVAGVPLVGVVVAEAMPVGVGGGAPAGAGIPGIGRVLPLRAETWMQAAESFFVVKVLLPRLLKRRDEDPRKQESQRSREDFIAWASREFSDHGLVGIHEGSVFEPWEDRQSEL